MHPVAVLSLIAGVTVGNVHESMHAIGVMSWKNSAMAIEHSERHQDFKIIPGVMETTIKDSRNEAMLVKIQIIGRDLIGRHHQTSYAIEKSELEQSLDPSATLLWLYQRACCGASMNENHETYVSPIDISNMKWTL